MALAIGMAEWIPYLRAAYEHDATTPRWSGEPPTANGFPWSEGSVSSSTAQKNASRSRWIIFRRSMVSLISLEPAHSHKANQLNSFFFPKLIDLLVCEAKHIDQYVRSMLA